MSKDFLVPIDVDIINEYTASAGVTIDDLLIKDYTVTAPDGSATSGQWIKIKGGAGDTGEVGGAIFLEPGLNNSVAGYDTINIGNPSESTNSLVLIQTQSSATNTGIWLKAKGTSSIYLEPANNIRHILTAQEMNWDTSGTTFTQKISSVTEATGYDLIFIGGVVSGTTGDYDGGNILLYGGAGLNSGDRGQIYFGNGVNLATLQSNESGANVVVYNTTTGLLEHRTVASISGSSITIGNTGQIPYSNTGTPGTDFDYEANFTYDGTTLLIDTDVSASKLLSLTGSPDPVYFDGGFGHWRFAFATSDKMRIDYDADGNFTTGSTSPIIMSGTGGVELKYNNSTRIETISAGIHSSYDLVFTERADHASTPAAGFGYLWVKSDTPSSLIFTDDAGTDYDLTVSSGGEWTADANGITYADNVGIGVASSATYSLYVYRDHASNTTVKFENPNVAGPVLALASGDEGTHKILSIGNGLAEIFYIDGYGKVDGISGDFSQNFTIAGNLFVGGTSTSADVALFSGTHVTNFGLVDFKSTNAAYIRLTGGATSGAGIYFFSDTTYRYSIRYSYGTTAFEIGDGTTTIFSIDDSTNDITLSNDLIIGTGALFVGATSTSASTAVISGAHVTNFGLAEFIGESDHAYIRLTAGVAKGTGIYFNETTTQRWIVRVSTDDTFQIANSVGNAIHLDPTSLDLTLGGDLLLDSCQIKFDKPTGATTDSTAIVMDVVAGESLSVGSVVAISPTLGRAYLADTNVTNDMPARGIMLAAVTAGNTGTMVLYGIVRYDTWNWSTSVWGKTLFVHDTSNGQMETTPTTTAGHSVQAVGWVIDDDHIFINCSPDWFTN